MLHYQVLTYATLVDRSSNSRLVAYSEVSLVSKEYSSRLPWLGRSVVVFGACSQEMSISSFSVPSFLLVLLMILVIVSMCFQGLLGAVTAVSSVSSPMGSNGPLLVWSACLGWIRSVVP